MTHLNQPCQPREDAPPDITLHGRFPRIAVWRDDWYRDVLRPELALQHLAASGHRADLFTFVQRLPDTTPHFDYPMEMDNVAAVEIASFDDWWTRVLSKSTRKHVRRSAKRGVEVRRVAFDDALLRGIAGIYNETRIRQGRPFSHYGEALDKLRASHATFLECSDFIGAFLGEELIGFIKLVYAGTTGRSMQILSAIAHRDKWPNNALIAKAVELCAARGTRYLVYGKYDYGKTGSDQLVAFKAENGFRNFAVPRYYVPVSRRGRLALRAGLHRGVLETLPRPLIKMLYALRAGYFGRRYGTVAEP